MFSNTPLQPNADPGGGYLKFYWPHKLVQKVHLATIRTCIIYIPVHV